MNLIKSVIGKYYEVRLEGKLEMLKVTERNQHITGFLDYCHKVREKGFENLYLRYIYDFQDWREEQIRRGCEHT